MLLISFFLLLGKITIKLFAPTFAGLYGSILGLIAASCFLIFSIEFFRHSKTIGQSKKIDPFTLSWLYMGTFLYVFNSFITD